DDDRASLGRHRARLTAHRGRRARQDDLDAGEGFGPDGLDGVRFTFEVDPFARAALRGEEFDRAEGELPFDQDLPHDFADRTGRAHDCNARLHGIGPLLERGKNGIATSNQILTNVDWLASRTATSRCWQTLSPPVWLTRTAASTIEKGYRAPIV